MIVFYFTQAPGQDKLRERFLAKCFPLSELSIYWQFLNVFHYTIYRPYPDMLLQQQCIPVNIYSTHISHVIVPKGDIFSFAKSKQTLTR